MYTSIVTDTGAYRHSNVTERTHKISATLKKIGVDNTFIYQSLFDNKDFSRIKLIGKALSNMQLILNGKVALLEIDKIFLTPKMLADLIKLVENKTISSKQAILSISS